MKIRPCRVCGEPSEPTRSYCKDCRREMDRERSRRRREEDRKHCGARPRMDGAYQMIACPNCDPAEDLTGSYFSGPELKQLLLDGYMPSGAQIQSPRGVTWQVEGKPLKRQRITHVEAL